MQILKSPVWLDGEKHKSLASVKLAPVLPEVLYTGTYRWERLGQLIDLMDDADDFREHLPQFEPLFLELRELSVEHLHTTGVRFGRVPHLVQQRKSPASLFRGLLQQELSALEAMRDEQHLRWQELLSYLVGLVYHDRPRQEQEPLVQIMRASARSDEFIQEIDMARQTMAQFHHAEGRILSRLDAWLVAVLDARSLQDMKITPAH